MMEARDARDLQLLERITEVLDEHTPRPGNTFKCILMHGQFPNTEVTVVFSTPRGDRSRSYEVWQTFDTEDPDGIARFVFVDVMETF